jgi:hypothetical protein
MTKEFYTEKERKEKLRKAVFAKQKQYEDIVKKACPSIDNKSGVYFYTRTDLVTGEKFAYIGLAKRLLARCCQHMLGYQHIDISIRKRGLYSKENEGGWKLNCLHFPEHLIEEKERFYIEQYQKANVTLLNIEGGGRQGKVDIAERKPTKTYTDGLSQGDKRTKRKVKEYFDKYLDFQVRLPSNKIKERKYNEFKEWLNNENEEK